VILGAVATGMSVEPAGGLRAEPVGRPNIILILVDDLGYGDVGVFHQNQRLAAADRAQPAHRTPALDELAARGMTLPHHYCPAPVCAPSRASLLLGVHQGHANVRDNQFDKALEDNHTLATLLRSAGYRTVAIGKYGLQGDPQGSPPSPPDWPAHPNRRGFDEFFGLIRHRDGHEHYPKEGIHRGPKEVWHNEVEISARLDKCYTTDLFTARAKHEIVRHMAARPDQPFFMYLAYDTPHAVLSLPTQAYPAGGGRDGGLQWLGRAGGMINTASGEPDSHYHPDYAAATWDHDGDAATPEIAWPDVQKRYASVVRRIDDGIGDLTRLLGDLGIAGNTLIVVTSDNGPSIESYLPEPFEPTFFQGYGPYDGIKRDLREAGVHVGGIVCWPDRVPAGSTTGDHATAFWDWMPTFCQAAGIAPPARSDGVSLLPLLSGRPDSQPPSTIYSEYFESGATPPFADFTPANRGRRRNQMQLLREGRYVGVRYDVRSHRDDFEIFDIVADPRQSRNLAAGLPEVQARFKDRVLQLRRSESSAARPYDDLPVPPLAGPPIAAEARWAVFAGDHPYAPSSANLEPTRRGTAADIAAAIESAAQAARGQVGRPAASIRGMIEVPVEGRYTLHLAGAGPAVVRVHEAVVIDDDFGHRPGRPAAATIRLAAGSHPVAIELVLAEQSRPRFSWDRRRPAP